MQIEKEKHGFIRDTEILHTKGNEAFYLGKMNEALDYYEKGPSPRIESQTERKPAEGGMGKEYYGD